MIPTVLKYERLRTEQDLWAPVPEVGRRVRAGETVIVVVSAVAAAERALANQCQGSPSAQALLRGTADRRAAALLTSTLCRAGVSAVTGEPADLGVGDLVTLLKDVVVLPRAAATDRLLNRLGGVR